MRRSLVLALALLLAVAGRATVAAEPDADVVPARPPSTATDPSAIDRLVLARLDRLGIAPAADAKDSVFLRRAFLDVIGTLPTPDEARRFLADARPDKRALLVDRLLERDEFNDWWAMRLSGLLRVKSEFPINLWPNAVQAYHRFLRTALRDRTPLDRLARTLLTSSGSNFRVPAVNFFRAVQRRSPASLAQAAALTFMGVRPEGFSKERWDGMAGFFSRVGYKTTAEWKEEIVFFDVTKPDPVAATFPDGRSVTIPPLVDPRELFADWLTDAKNPWFARSLANRAWSWLLGRGVVHEPDDFRPDNPPSNPELLALLEKELVARRFDLRAFFRLVLGSKTYQRSSVPAKPDPRAAAEFACYPVRRLEAEVLIDAIDQVTGTTEEYTSKIPEPFTYMPDAQRAIALPDASISSPFLELFGRSPRNTGLESEQRDSLPTSEQALHLLNSTHIRRKIEQGPALRAVARLGTPREAIAEVYLAVLSRFPTFDEMTAAAHYAEDVGDARRAGLDLVWALVNSAEFQHRH